MAQSTAELIGQILAQAENTNIEAEQMLFFARAQKLATREGIDLAVARAAKAKAEEREQPEHRKLTLGRRGQPALSWYCELAQTIGRNNDLQMTMAHNSTYINFYGMPSDIDVAEAIYSSCISAMVSGGNAYLKSGEYKKEILPLRKKRRSPNPDYDTERPSWDRQTDYWGKPIPKYVYEWSTEMLPISGMTARQNFYRGFVNEISRRLSEARREARAAVVAEVREIEAAAAPGETSTELVLREKSKEVSVFYDQATAGRVSKRGWSGSKSPVYHSSSASAGSSHAKGVDLGGRKSITTGPTRIGS